MDSHRDRIPTARCVTAALGDGFTQRQNPNSTLCYCCSRGWIHTETESQQHAVLLLLSGMDSHRDRIPTARCVTAALGDGFTQRQNPNSTLCYCCSRGWIHTETESQQHAVLLLLSGMDSHRDRIPTARCVTAALGDGFTQRQNPNSTLCYCCSRGWIHTETESQQHAVLLLLSGMDSHRDRIPTARCVTAALGDGFTQRQNPNSTLCYCCSRGWIHTETESQQHAVLLLLSGMDSHRDRIPTARCVTAALGDGFTQRQNPNSTLCYCCSRGWIHTETESQQHAVLLLLSGMDSHRDRIPTARCVTAALGDGFTQRQNPNSTLCYCCSRGWIHTETESQQHAVLLLLSGMDSHRDRIPTARCVTAALGDGFTQRQNPNSTLCYCCSRGWIHTETESQQHAVLLLLSGMDSHRDRIPTARCVTAALGDGFTQRQNPNSTLCYCCSRGWIHTETESQQHAVLLLLSGMDSHRDRIPTARCVTAALGDGFTQRQNPNSTLCYCCSRGWIHTETESQQHAVLLLLSGMDSHRDRIPTARCVTAALGDGFTQRQNPNSTLCYCCSRGWIHTETESQQHAVLLLLSGMDSHRDRIPTARCVTAALGDGFTQRQNPNSTLCYCCSRGWIHTETESQQHAVLLLLSGMDSHRDRIPTARCVTAALGDGFTQRQNPNSTLCYCCSRGWIHTETESQQHAVLLLLSGMDSHRDRIPTARCVTAALGDGFTQRQNPNSTLCYCCSRGWIHTETESQQHAVLLLLSGMDSHRDRIPTARCVTAALGDGFTQRQNPNSTLCYCCSRGWIHTETESQQHAVLLLLSGMDSHRDRIPTARCVTAALGDGFTQRQNPNSTLCYCCSRGWIHTETESQQHAVLLLLSGMDSHRDRIPTARCVTAALGDGFTQRQNPNSTLCYCCSRGWIHTETESQQHAVLLLLSGMDSHRDRIPTARCVTAALGDGFTQRQNPNSTLCYCCSRGWIHTETESQQHAVLLLLSGMDSHRDRIPTARCVTAALGDGFTQRQNPNSTLCYCCSRGWIHTETESQQHAVLLLLSGMDSHRDRIPTARCVTACAVCNSWGSVKGSHSLTTSPLCSV
ncbi:UNVERIFIED_CONTAM: hypothetical protein FKN15_030549 [Acipenser sinensis]